MKRRTKDEQGNISESKIISTQDIYLGANTNDSLDDHIKEIDDDIKKLKKYTKWYVKYGGMGSGGGGGTTTSSFGYKVYFKDTNSNVVELSGTKANLSGAGTYTVSFNLTKTQGHSFTIKYVKGDSDLSTNGITKIISEGNTKLDVSLSFTTKTFFKFRIIDNATDDDTGEVICTVIPDPYSISPSLAYKDGGSVEKNSSISYNSLVSNVSASFSYSIYEAVEVLYKVRYKIETDESWTTLYTGTFPYDSSGETKTGIITLDLSESSIKDLSSDNSIGKQIYIELIYGQSSDSTVTPEGSYTLTIVPQGYYILLQDKDSNTNRLFLEDPVEKGTYDISTVPRINKGYIPFYINLCYTYDGSGEVYINIYKSNGSGNWINTISDSSLTINTNRDYSISSTYKISVIDSGLYKIVASIGKLDTATIVTTKYFYVKEESATWSFNKYGEDSKDYRTSNSFYYSDYTSPFLTSPVEFYRNSYTKTIDTTKVSGLKYNYNIVLGIQYDKSNTDSISFLRLSDGTNTIDVFQNKVQYNNVDLISSYYFPKTENSDDSDNTKWHLLNININYIKTSKDGKNYYYEFILYIDGVIEGIGSGKSDSSNSIALNKAYKFSNITINPESSQILKMNLFEVTMTSIDSNIEFTNKTIGDKDNEFYSNYKYIYDIYAEEYYNKYRINIEKESEIIETSQFISHLGSFNFDQYGIPYTSLSNISSIINDRVNPDDNDSDKLLKVPILILCPDETSSTSVGTGKFFTDWFLAKWPETASSAAQKPSQLTGYIYYIPENETGDDLSNFKIMDSDRSNNIVFTFDIQGSSTRSYGIKNIELGIQQGTTTTRVFTPNFDKDDTNTFLPEKSFTLKADIVDSSTCNNNSVGGFINNNTKPLDNDNCPSRKTAIGGHIKNCLTGFPVLVFINIDNSNGTGGADSKCYFAGIYNFNLGRESYFNLGYYTNIDSKILGLMTDDDQGSFKILDIPNPTIHDNLVVTEISTGLNYFDFSQYDYTVLFPANESDEHSMFSWNEDSIYNDEASAKETLESAIYNISLTGGFIFEKLQKNFKKIGSTESLVYTLHDNNHVSYNYVSDYKTQYSRVNGTTTFNEISKPGDSGSSNDFINCIGIKKYDSITESYTNSTPTLDLRSTVEYYVICMIFGMVDSVLKNLELKAWNKTTIFPAFYDMDTCLGVDNKGNDVGFFAYSDYWYSEETEYDGEGSNKYKAGEVKIYPDFFDKNLGSTGYDIPSSYLFSIAKYSTLTDILGISGDILPVIGTTETNTDSTAVLSPVNIYALFRQIGGDLETSEVFIEKYFSNRLKNIPESFKNLNYRSKYAKITYWQLTDYNPDVIDKEHSVNMKCSDFSDIEKFKGTGTYKKIDWLSSRLHLLDAYLNITTDVQYRIRKADLVEDESGNVTSVTWSDIEKGENDYYYYPNLKNINVTFSSDDVSITSQIFQSGTQSNLDINKLLVQAPSNTPVILYRAMESPVSYLIGDDTKTKYFNIKLNTAGVKTWSLNGSKEFTYINNLGLFNLSESTITSNNLGEVTYVSDSDATVTETGYTINSPNITKLTFNGSIYTGEIVLSDSLNYNRLEEINLSGSSTYINTTKSLPVTKLELSNLDCSGNEVSLPNLTKLETVTLDGINIKTLSLSSWKNNISFTGNLSNISDTSSYDYHNLKITNLTISGSRFSGSTITINKIDKLQTLSVSGVETLNIYNCDNLSEIKIDSSIKNITVQACSSKASSLTIYNNTKTSGIIDLTACTNLEYMHFRETRHFTTVKVSSLKIINVYSYGFYKCFELAYIDTIATAGNNPTTIELQGPSVFQVDGNFTLTSTDGTYPRILFGSSLKDASNMFNVNGSGAASITHAAIDNFISFNKSNSRTQITDISNICYMQSKIGSDWSWTSTISGLNGFTNITNASHSFAYCGITYWNLDMFNFGASSGLNLNGTYYSSSVKVRTNFLSKIGSKCSKYTDLSGDNQPTCSLTFYGSTGTTALSSVSLKDVIYLPNATEMSAFCNITNSTVDLKDCFSNATKLTNIWGFMWNCSKWKNLTYEYTDSEGETKRKSCFWALTNLISLYCGFNKTNSEEIDLFNLFDTSDLSTTKWRTLACIYNRKTNKFNGVTYNNSSNWDDQFSATKYISYENFETLQTLLANNPNIDTLENIFKNCKITGCSKKPELDLKLTSSNTNITSLNYLYKGLKAYNSSNEEVSILLNEDFFEYIPNISTCKYTFSEIWFNTQIPFNLFKKRSNEINAVGYYPDKVTNSFTRDTSRYEYVYYYSSSSSGTVPSLPSNNSTSAASSFISTSSSSIDTWITSKNYSTSMTRKCLWYTKRTKTVGEDLTITYGNWESISVDNNLIEEFKTPIAVTVRYFNYNNRLITDVSHMFYDCRFENPCFTYDDSLISENTSYIKDSNDNYYSTYYTNQNCTSTSEGSYRESKEIDDLSGVTCDITSKPVVGGVSFTNYSLYHESFDNKYYPFISPDFFLGVKSSCEITAVFGCSSTTSNSEISNNKYILEGYIPEHLLNPVLTSITGAKNWIENLNILPVKYKSTNDYVFIPRNFISSTLGDISYLFNFHIRVPSYTVGSSNNRKYYVMYSDSIKTGSNQVSFDHTLPVYTLHADTVNAIVVNENTDTGPTEVYKGNYNFNYHILAKVSADGESLTNDGVNTYFTSASYERMISKDLLYVISGLIWTKDYYLESINNNSINVFTGEIVWSGHHGCGINKYLELPSTSSVFSSKKLFYRSPQYINSNTVGSSTSSQAIWKETYTELTIVTT